MTNDEYLAQIERERQAEQAKRAALPGLAAEVAGHLGDGWSADDPHPDWPGVVLHGPDGAELYVRYQGYREFKRLEISSHYPDGDREAYRAQRFEITVSAEKPPARIAGDISRRLLPGYLVELASCREAIDKHRAAEAQRAEVVAELGALLRTTPPRHAPDRLSMPAHVEAHGHIEVNYYGTSARLDLGSVPMEKVRQIVKILAE